MAAEYSDVKLVGDASEFQCVRCDHLLFQHYISNCGHAFCVNCKRILDDGSQKWKCPRCQEYIKTIDVQNEEFDRKFKEMSAYCPNKKYGCLFVDQLKSIQSHLKDCDFTREKCLPTLIEDQENMSMSVEYMFDMNEKFRKVYAEMNEMREKIFHLEKPDRANENTSSSLETQLIDIKSVVHQVKADMKAELKGIREELDKIKNVDLALEECKTKLSSEYKGQSDAVYRLLDYKEEKLLKAIEQVKKEFGANISELRAEIKAEVNEKYQILLSKNKNLSKKIEVLQVGLAQQIIKIDQLNSIHEIEKVKTVNEGLKSNVQQIENSIKDLETKINRRLDEFGVLQKQVNENNIKEQSWSTLHNIKLNEQDLIIFQHTLKHTNILEYVGRGITNFDIGLAQASEPVNPSKHYFEVKILDPGVDQYPFISIGLTHLDYPKGRHPGWNLGSIGYHGDDGKVFTETAFGEPFGPKCKKGDRMGCGTLFPRDFHTNSMNRKTVQVYFTRNSEHLGYRTVNIPPGGFYPAVGIRSLGVKVRIDFHALAPINV